jgi:hypothetical protein
LVSVRVKFILEGDSDNSADEESSILEFRTDNGAIRHQIQNGGDSKNLEIIAGSEGTTTAGNNCGIVFHTKTAGALSEPNMWIQANGNVGIGTSSPSTELEVVATSPTIQARATANNVARLSLDSNRAASVLTGQIDGKWNGNTVSRINFVNGADGVNKDDGLITFNTSSSNSNPQERMRIDSNGRLLVGTSSSYNIGGGSAAKTQIVEQGGALTLSLTNYVNGSSGAYLALGASRGSTSGDFTILQSGDRLGQIRFAGADGVDLTSIGAEIKAEVDGTPGSNDMPGRLVFSTTADGASTPTVRMVINSFGTVLIGKTVDSVTEGGLTLTASGFTRIVRDNDVPLILQRLNTDGNIQIFRRDNATVGSISVTTTATAYNTSSDYRLKENVVPMTGAADRVKALKPSRFNFIADPDTTVDGFLAHEAQDVVPECVTGTKDEVDDEGNPVYQGIDQSKIVPLLTAALQEALAKIEALEQRLADAGL